MCVLITIKSTVNNKSFIFSQFHRVKDHLLFEKELKNSKNNLKLGHVVRYFCKTMLDLAGSSQSKSIWHYKVDPISLVPTLFLGLAHYQCGS